MPWFLYIVRCNDGSLYTGIATDVGRRVSEHERGDGKGAKYLRGKTPLRLVFAREVGSRDRALRVESRVKKRTKAWKEALLEGDGPFDRLLAESE